MRFTDDNLDLILQGKKTQTRRMWTKPQCQVGKIYFAQSKRRRGIPIKITDMYRQRLGDISQEEIRKEGFNTLEEFQQVWNNIYGEWNDDITVWVIEFTPLSVEEACKTRV